MKTFDNQKNEEYEEIGEKRTSIIGYFLLVLMVIFMVVISQKIFDDLEDIPAHPLRPAYCLSIFKSSDYYKSLKNIQSCQFNQIDNEFGVASKYQEISADLSTIASLNRQMASKESQIENYKNSVNNYNSEYDISLQEKIAGEPPIYDKDSLKENIVYSQQTISQLTAEINNLEQQRNQIARKIALKAQAIGDGYRLAENKYRGQMDWYSVKIFLLQLIFVLPFFAAAVYFYFKLKKKNSPFTIIVTAILGASAILFLQITIMFLYEILPREWFAKIFRFFMEISILRYVIYYGVVILVIVIFGGIVYLIQKRVFSPLRVAIRRIKDNKCPGCSFSLNHDHNFCPKCGLQLKEECASCHQLRVKYLSHCPHCGNKKSEQN